MHHNHLTTEEFVKETRTDGVVTSLTIKLAAYDTENNFTTVTGDASFLTSTDSSFQTWTVTGETYNDYDNSTAIATQSFTYTVPVEDQTSLTQATTSSYTASEEIEYQAKRKAWYDAYSITENYHNAWAALYSAVEAL